MLVRHKTKNQKLQTGFSGHWTFFDILLGRSDLDWKGFNMIYHSTHSDNYLLYLILRENKKKKIKTHSNTKFLPIFQFVGTM